MTALVIEILQTNYTDLHRTSKACMTFANRLDGSQPFSSNKTGMSEIYFSADSNAIPSGAQWADCHRMIHRLIRKLGRPTSVQELQNYTSRTMAALQVVELISMQNDRLCV